MSAFHLLIPLPWSSIVMPRRRLPTFVLLCCLTLAAPAAFAQTTQESPHNAHRIPATSHHGPAPNHHGPDPNPNGSPPNTAARGQDRQDGQDPLPSHLTFDPTPPPPAPRTGAFSGLLTSVAANGDSIPGIIFNSALRAVMSSVVKDPNVKDALTALATAAEMSPQESLPVARIDTGGRTIVDEPKRPATLTITQGEEEIFSGPIGIEIRGHSSQLFAKKSYGFETWDEAGEDVDVALAGFPKEEDWILYGPFIDRTYVRNILAYQLSNDMGRYASRTKIMTLYINEDYRGVYVLMEKIKRDKNRVDISKNKASDVSGGYILEVDGYNTSAWPANQGFQSQYNHRGTRGSEPYNYEGHIIETPPVAFQHKYPKPEDITAAQKAYIKNYIDQFEDALYSENFKDPVNGYAKWIDVDSFIDYFLLYEFTFNTEAYNRSIFMYKDKGGKLNMGPHWDFNFALGNATGGWVYELYPHEKGKIYWWNRLFEDPAWVKKVKQRWGSLRRGVLTNGRVLSIINSNARSISSQNEHTKDSERWAEGRSRWGAGQENFESSLGRLRGSVQGRLAWMDNELRLNTDTVLSALTVTDATGAAIALEETFDAATTVYTASVASDVTSVTLAATPVYPNVSIDYALGDADFSASPTVTGLAEGINHITIRVTDADGAIGAYTLRLAQRAPPPPAPVEQAITLDWPLTPATIGAGNVFRLLYVSGDVGDARETDVAAYNTRIQQSAAAIHGYSNPPPPGTPPSAASATSFAYSCPPSPSMRAKTPPQAMPPPASPSTG